MMNLLLFMVMYDVVILQWSPNSRLLLFGTSGGDVLIHDSAGELIVSAMLLNFSNIYSLVSVF